MKAEVVHSFLYLGQYFLECGTVVSNSVPPG